MLLVSLFVKKDLYTVVIQSNGRIIAKDISKVNADEEGVYDKLILCFRKMIRLLRNYIEQNREEDRVVIELNNSTFIKWLEFEYATEEYQEQFMKLIKEFNELPIQYNIVFNGNPLAKKFANETKRTDKVALTGLSID